MLNIAIAIPTYNESKNIRRLLEAIYNMAKDQRVARIGVYVVDDSSPDGTAEVATAVSQELKNEVFETHLLKRPKKEGLGKAYIDAFQRILAENKWDYILQMDADLSHDPSYISQFMAKASEGVEFIVGSRYAKGGGAPEWSWFRKFLSRGGNAYARMVLGRGLSDYTGGFNMYSVGLLGKIQIENISAMGYGFLVELKYKALKHCKSLAEIPIIFVDRTHGKSKIPQSTILRNFALVFKLKFFS